MSQTGVGVLINQLSGSADTMAALQAAQGKTIRAVAIGGDDERLVFTFDDGTRLSLFDDGQSCCEHRFMKTDDDLAPFVGARFTGAETREGPTVDGEYDETECEFLVITTSAGVFTVANYNQNNGYYGGFSLTAATLGPTEDDG